MTDWDSWAKHVKYVVDTRGRWYGLGDKDGNPIMTLPEPTSTDTPRQWADSPDLKITFSARSQNGTPTRLAQLLVIDELNGFDPSGQLPVAEEDYMILVAFPGPDGTILRHGGTIVYAEGQDTDNDGIPNELTVSALNIMDVWNTTPAMSWPSAWWAATPYERDTDESAIPYEHPHLMARIELATHTTFTWKNGPAAFVIRRLAQESLDAAGFAQKDPDGTRWVDDPYTVVEVPEVDTSPTISLEARDSMLWDTVSKQAKNAGIIFGARLWWPGDPAVRCWNQVTSTMSPAEVDISPSQGESKRTLSYRTFPHAMIILTAKEVAK